MKDKRFVLIILLIFIVFWNCAPTGNPPREQRNETKVSATCGPDIDLSKTINEHLSSADWTENGEAAETLLLQANKSAACRTAIIKQLINAMSKANPDLIDDPQSYHLWSTGAVLLGELKAVEALDLLIPRLDLNDGHFSASGVHQPVVFGIRKMGSLAVPKLDVALKHNANRNIQLAAALCLADIGGEDAKHSLKTALESTTDPCVRRFVELSLEPPTDDVLKQRILAYRCGD